MALGNWTNTILTSISLALAGDLGSLFRRFGLFHLLLSHHLWPAGKSQSLEKELRRNTKRLFDSESSEETQGFESYPLRFHMIKW